MTSATQFSDTVQQGADYFLTVLDRADDKVTPTDLTGCTARLQARRTFEDAEPAVDMTSEPAAGLTITPLEGKIEVHLTAAQTAELSGVYIVQMEVTTAGGTVTRVLDGIWEVSPEIVK